MPPCTTKLHPCRCAARLVELVSSTISGPAKWVRSPNASSRKGGEGPRSPSPSSVWLMRCRSGLRGSERRPLGVSGGPFCLQPGQECHHDGEPSGRASACDWWPKAKRHCLLHTLSAIRMCSASVKLLFQPLLGSRHRSARESQKLNNNNPALLLSVCQPSTTIINHPG